MEINYINQTDEEKWNQFEVYLEPILLETLKKTNRLEEVVVNVVLVNDAEIHQYNAQYRNIDRPTDVLSFEDGTIEEGTMLMGDIIISVDAVERQAKEYGHSVKREFCFLVTHGYLHCLGYDHHSEVEEKEMFGLQKEILNDIAPKNS